LVPELHAFTAWLNSEVVDGASAFVRQAYVAPGRQRLAAAGRIVSATTSLPGPRQWPSRAWVSLQPIPSRM